MSCTESDDEGIRDIETQLETLSSTIQSLLESVESFERELLAMERPIANIALAQLGDVPYLATSPFRAATFAFRPPGIPGIEQSRRYPFRELCELLRTYLYQMKLVDTNETVHLNKVLQTVFQLKEDTVPYVRLIGTLRNVLF